MVGVGSRHAMAGIPPLETLLGGAPMPTSRSSPAPLLWRLRNAEPMLQPQSLLSTDPAPVVASRPGSARGMFGRVACKADEQASEAGASRAERWPTSSGGRLVQQARVGSAPPVRAAAPAAATPRAARPGSAAPGAAEMRPIVALK
eukprot:3983776-Prymnesium_polylepis.1